jgi:NAD dependent epimerase/dehydratase family
MSRFFLGSSSNNNGSRRNPSAATSSTFGIITGPVTQQNQPGGLSRRHGQAISETSVLTTIFSRQTFVILAIGMIVGYVVLPVLLIEMDTSSSSSSDNSSSRIRYPSGILTSSSNNFELKEQRSSSSSSLFDNNNNNNNNEIVTDPYDRNLDLSSSVEEQDRTTIQQRLMEDMALLSQQSIPTLTTPYPMKTAKLPDHLRKKILITGGAGFVGSHLVDKLMMEGHDVIVLDNFFTGQKKNVAHWFQHPQFT